MAKIERTVQEGSGPNSRFFKETITSPEAGASVTLRGEIPASYAGQDLDNIPVMFGDRSVSVPAAMIKECVKREEVDPPKRADEVQA